MCRQHRSSATSAAARAVDYPYDLTTCLTFEPRMMPSTERVTLASVPGALVDDIGFNVVRACVK